MKGFRWKNTWTRPPQVAPPDVCGQCTCCHSLNYVLDILDWNAKNNKDPDVRAFAIEMIGESTK